MRPAEAGIVPVGPLFFEPGDRGAQVVEQGRAVDFVGQGFDLEPLDRRRGGLEGRHVLPHRRIVELPQLGVAGNRTGGARRRRIQVSEQILVRFAEWVELAHHATGFAATSEWSPRVTLPARPSTSTLFPMRAPSS